MTLPVGWKRFRYHTYSSMVITLARLAYEYPEVARVYTTQAEYNLAAAGESCIIDMNQPMSQEALMGLNERARLAVQRRIDDLRQLDGLPINACRVWVIDITDRSAGVESSIGAQTDRPQILISGALHGDERIGPTAVTELAAVLVEAGFFPRSGRTAEKAHRQESSETTASIFGTDTKAIASWLHYLVQHRRITIVPAANAVGFAQGERTELGVDPNRDFPWNQASPLECMQSIAARSIHELVLANTYQLLLTFHGGTTVIGYEWGDMVHCPEQHDCQRNAPAPDIVSMQTIAFALRSHAGAGTHYGTRPFEIGTMGDTVYPVAGGMEDWAYGASVLASQQNLVTACKPNTFGGYGPSKTLAVRGQAAARMIALLVETADEKQPPEDRLGARQIPKASSYCWRADVRLLSERQAHHENSADLDTGTLVEGHVWRNVRLSLQAIDILEPYAEFTRFPSNEDGNHANTSASLNKACWRIGGSYRVFETQLEAWRDRTAAGIDQSHPRSEPIYRSRLFRDEHLEQIPGYPAVRLGQSTRWSLDGNGGQEYCVTLDDLMPSTKSTSAELAWFLRVRLQADLDWGQTPAPEFETLPPNTPPWSHLARLRTDITRSSVKESPDARKEPEARSATAKNWYSVGLHCRVLGGGLSGTSHQWLCRRVTRSSATSAMSGWTKLLVAVSIFLLAPGSFPLLLFVAFLVWRLVRGESVHPALVWYEARQRVRFWIDGLGALGTGGRGLNLARPAASHASAVELEETKRRMLTPLPDKDRDTNIPIHEDIEASA
ncbi:hypothetical protein CCYA_CCYA13G3513 [Cyanidiococcus yangmingshanensis]|nr:hypothetical protein CCYA_CCYA13G3513 [Cyanidiococcus yangmingshanensis]